MVAGLMGRKNAGRPEHLSSIWSDPDPDSFATTGLTDMLADRAASGAWDPTSIGPKEWRSAWSRIARLARARRRIPVAVAPFSL